MRVEDILQCESISVSHIDVHPNPTGLDYFCVQSYDGQLSFFECEVAAFSRFLPSFLIPGPLCYCTQSDSFITCSAAMELECYKYKVLATATGEKTSGDWASTHVDEDL